MTEKLGRKNIRTNLHLDHSGNWKSHTADIFSNSKIFMIGALLKFKFTVPIGERFRAKNSKKVLISLWKIWIKWPSLKKKNECDLERLFTFCWSPFFSTISYDMLYNIFFWRRVNPKKTAIQKNVNRIGKWLFFTSLEIIPKLERCQLKIRKWN